MGWKQDTEIRNKGMIYIVEEVSFDFLKISEGEYGVLRRDFGWERR